MLIVETIAKIRRMHYVQNKGFKTIARELGLSKNTVKEVIRKNKTSLNYQRQQSHYPALEAYKERLIERLKSDMKGPARFRRTAKKYHEEIVQEGYKGQYGAVNNFINGWKRSQNSSSHTGFIPLSFAPGEAFQFDWSTEEIELAGQLTRIKVAQLRLCHSRFFLTIAYPNEQLEMLLDAHDQAFSFFGGSCCKGIYDNMKTAVTEILLGKERIFNKRFLEMCSHYLFEAIACTPASGWEKGQVEKQVNTSRNNFFTPKRCVESLDILNAELQQSCMDWAKKTKHPELADHTVWEIYQQEILHLLPLRGLFQGYKVQMTRVNSLSLVHIDTNSYSVDCQYNGQPVEVRIYAKKIVVTHQDSVIAEHNRCFLRHQRIYNPWHYVSLLERKPGALRNGAPFQSMPLPHHLQRVRERLSAYSDGDKQFIQLLLQVKTAGLAPVEKACEKALRQGSCSADLILQYLEKNEPVSQTTPSLLLTHVPKENAAHYNQLLHVAFIASPAVLEVCYA